MRRCTLRAAGSSRTSAGGDLVLEADGAHHDDPFERVADRERQAILEAHGFRVIRVTWAQAIARPGATLRRIGDAGAPRGVESSA